MTDTHSDANPAGVTQEAGEDLSPEALIARALTKPEAKSEPQKKEATEEKPDSSEEVDETETQEQEEETEETKSEEKSEEGDDTVLSQIDFEALDEEGIKQFGEMLTSHVSPEQAAVIAQAMGTKGGQEYGKMRGQLRAKDQEIENLKAQLQEGLSKVVPSNNPLNSITSVDTLDEVAKNSQDWHTYLDGLIAESTDEYFDVNGQEMSRKEVATLRNTYKTYLDAVPERRKALEDLSNLTELKDKELSKVKESISFLSDEESEGYKAWRTEIDSPEFAILTQAFPRQGAKLAAMVAKAIAFDQKPVAPKKFNLPLKGKSKAIGDVGSGASSNKRGANKQRQQIQEKISQGEFGDRDVAQLIAGAFSR